MDDRAALLNQLRIDRSKEDPDDSARPWLKWLIGLVVIVSLGIGTWIALAPPPGPSVTVAVAPLSVTDAVAPLASVAREPGVIVTNVSSLRYRRSFASATPSRVRTI